MDFPLRLYVFLLLALVARAEPARIQVFIALVDNRAQGIIPVPAKVGDGDDANQPLLGMLRSIEARAARER